MQADERGELRVEPVGCLLQRPALLHLREALLLADQAQEVGDDLDGRRLDLHAAQRVVVHDLLREGPDRRDRGRLEQRLGHLGDDRADDLEHAVDDRVDEAPTSRRNAST